MVLVAWSFAMTVSLSCSERPTTATTLPTLTTSPTLWPSLSPKINPEKLAIRVIRTDGQPLLDLQDISEISVQIEPEAKWIMGPKPDILARFADGWVQVDRSMVTLAQRGMTVDMIFRDANGMAMTVSTVAPSDEPGRLEFKLLADSKWIGFGPSAVPAKVAKDEAAGIVVDADGKPIAGATVSLPRFLPGAPDYAPAVVTKADGVFRLAKFQWYLMLRVEKPGYGTRWIMDVPLGHAISVSLDRTTRFKGQAVLADGTPAAGATIALITAKPTARVEMANPIGDITINAVADGEGRYDIPIEPGEYETRLVTPAGQFARALNQRIALGQSLALPDKLGPGVTFQAHVVDSITQKPVAGANLWITDRSPGLVGILAGSLRKTDKDGIARWNSIMPGRTSIGFHKEGYTRWWRDTPESHRRRSSTQRYSRDIDDIWLDLTRDMPEVLINTEPGMTVTGQVLSPDGKPVAGASVDVAGLLTGDNRYSKITDADGRFTLSFPNLDNAEKQYAVVANDRSGHWANVNSEPFVATAGGSKSYVMQLTRGGRVQGRVVDTHGNPVPRIEVEAIAADGMDRDYYNPRTLTDADGRFEINAMRPANYAIQPDISFGVNVMHEPTQTPKEVNVIEGDLVVVGDLVYTGPPVPPVPEVYEQYYGNRRQTPATQPSK